MYSLNVIFDALYENDKNLSSLRVFKNNLLYFFNFILEQDFTLKRSEQV